MQVERLLRSIYQPQNYYCIHIDSKADESTKNAMAAITKCFDNVFVASRLESVSKLYDSNMFVARVHVVVFRQFADSAVDIPFSPKTRVPSG